MKMKGKKQKETTCKFQQNMKITDRRNRYKKNITIYPKVVVVTTSWGRTKDHNKDM